MSHAAITELKTIASTRNPGVALDIPWVRSIQSNRSAIERRAATLPARRTVKKDWQAAWNLKAISCIDLTTLSGDDTESRVRRLCVKAKQPVHPHILAALNSPRLSVAAVCVYHEMIAAVIDTLKNTDISVAAVSTGFPAGLSALDVRVKEIEYSVSAGATEIDVVISRRHVLESRWDSLYEEIKEFRHACGDAHIKVILATGDLGTLRNIARASLVAMMAGADFIKTSTGKEAVNATIPASLVMLRCIRDYFDRTGYKVGFKAAGGISKARNALSYLTLVKEELGTRWMQPDLLRIGASSLLGDIERQLEHHLYGRYSSENRHPIS
ncbi:MAG: deoxyribose-phosphate aldolase [Aestuariivita sp.]|nr:deoxyribose-phosphate aldolase [Aestuariivita sp.]